MCDGSWAGLTYLRYTVLMSFNKSETALHSCNPTLSVLVMLVSQNVFHVVSAFQFIVFPFFWLIRFLVDPTLETFIVSGPLEFLVSQKKALHRENQNLEPTSIPGFLSFAFKGGKGWRE